MFGIVITLKVENRLKKLFWLKLLTGKYISFKKPQGITKLMLIENPPNLN
jgi:HKD family nuclease